MKNQISTQKQIVFTLVVVKMYWINRGTDKIQRANLDGTNVRDIITGLNDPSGLALDIDGISDVAPDTNKLTTTWANVKVQ